MSTAKSTAIFTKTVATQRAVAMPDHSAWVAANAGSGKTKVLTDRVMRLLLSGSDPSKILCITFTKAAAAEMAERLFKRLGDWALMDDEALKEQLTELDGLAARSAEQLSAARQLFARALETPGGLKIQTIHSFCESILKRFPLEAGVMPGARVIEEHQSQQLLKDIVSDAGMRALSGDAQQREDFIALTKSVTEKELRKGLNELASKAPQIKAAIEKQGGAEAFYLHLADRLDADLGRTTLEQQADFLSRLDRSWLEGAYSAYLSGAVRDQGRGAALRELLDAPTADAGFKAAEAFFLTSGSPRKTMADKKAKESLPGIDSRMKEIQDDFIAATEKIKGRVLFDITTAFYRMALNVSEAYTRHKAARGWLDFDDLIMKTAALFESNRTDWVLYKLDQGIDHVLVDEAQDTSATQWRVINGPLQEFFAGEAAREIERTVFVVGDEKQSIYSFQGADVALFRTQQQMLQGRVTAAEKPFLIEDLTLSFRSTSPVLQFVDEVFNDGGAAKGVSEHTTLAHHAHRQGHAGIVELWPLVVKEKTTSGELWDKPVDMLGPGDPARRLAAQIADTIEKWLSTGEILASKGRPIRPGDVMILCQRRGPVFRELVRELTKKGVPTAGTDRIRLLDDMAVKDMLSALRFALQTDDDLSLGEILKSPLFGFCDADLLALTHERGKHSLWRRVQVFAQKPEQGDLEARCQEAVTILNEARSRGALAGAHAFMTSLLEGGSPTGWQRFYSRLGLAAREPLQELLNEALDFENGEPRSLQGFLAHIRSRETELKKEVDGGDDLVRIMTVHGSKGLEADIVILADAAYANFAKIAHFLPLGKAGERAGQYLPEEGLFVRSTSMAMDNPNVTKAREHAIAQRTEEYRRLFYVAATRARDRLYICGILSGNAKLENVLGKSSAVASWYSLAANAFARLKEKHQIIETDMLAWPGKKLRFEMAQEADLIIEEEEPKMPVVALPRWLRQPAEKEQGIRMLSPSHMASSFEAEDMTKAQAEEKVFSPLMNGMLEEEKALQLTPYARGNMLHLLLEKLPDIAADKRAQAGQRLIEKHHPALPDKVQEEWLLEVLTVLDDPAFQQVFGPGSRAEVPLMGVPKGARSDTVISGQIDRLFVGEEELLIVDFKTNRPPPTEVSQTPAAYITQLAAYRALLQEIYPTHKVSCALLWTWVAKLMPVPEEMLDHAFVHDIAAKTEP